MSEGNVIKTPAQLKKEAARQAKLEKFQKKQEALKAKAAAQAEKPKDAKKKPIKSGKPAVITYTFDHAEGEKKNVSGDMPPSYSPGYVEAAWYSWWEKEGFFKPEYGRDLSQTNPEGSYCMVIPPPNVTGVLHIGHALTNSIEDALVRYNRMLGKTTLWVPGCDHAGIATQVVVEKQLRKTRDLSRHDIGREAFIGEAMKWKVEKEAYIYKQLRAMGGTYDWDRASFTMDPKMCKAVTEAFIRMHDKGLIFRQNRLVNWSCSLKSAISDIEVEKIEVKGRTLKKVPGYLDPVEFGIIEEFKYKVVGSNDMVTVATTRLETMLGDTAVAIHPEDARYKHLHGKSVQHPFRNCALPIVLDSFVDMEFGTGCVKITPAHDFNDYEVGMRHKLPFVECISGEGLINDVCPMFAGMRRFDARVAVRRALEELDLYVQCLDHDMVVPTCSRSKDIVEPLLKPQWWINCKDMAARSIKKVQDGELKLIPSQFDKTWYTWLDDCRDWCISRQLWWGHQIPAYKVNLSGKESGDLDNDMWVSAHSEEEAMGKAVLKFKVPASEISLIRDEDVLDTWFSSGLFPFSTMNWPDNTVDLKTFYPNNVLETGHDILFFWVARMVMMGLELMDELPFTEVYLHPIIRDAHGIKMSKSLGNVVDPLHIVSGITLGELHKAVDNGYLDEKALTKARAGQTKLYPNGIPECGTDALRFALCSYLTQARDLNLDVLRIEGYRKFCNKMWNATKFALMQLGDSYTAPNRDLMMCKLETANFSTIDKWILHRAAVAISDTNTSLKEYQFQQCTTAIYNFWLYDLCDVYLEATKRVFYKGTENEKEAARHTLYTCLDVGLRLIHPFMPFISEELWQRLPRLGTETAPSLVVASYPRTGALWLDTQLESRVNLVKDIVHTARSVKDTYLESKAKPEVFLSTSESLCDLIAVMEDLIGSTKLHLNQSIPLGTAVGTVGNRCEVHVLVKGLVDPVQEINRLQTKREGVEKFVQQTKETIEKHTDKVPEHVRLANCNKLTSLRDELVTIDTAIANFRKLTDN